MTTSKCATPAAVGAEVHARAAKHAAETKCDYRDAVRIVLKADPALATAYSQPSATMATKTAAPAPAPLPQGKAAGEIVHQRAEAIREMDAGLTYQRAVNLVLAADPALKAAYART